MNHPLSELFTNAKIKLKKINLVTGYVSLFFLLTSMPSAGDMDNQHGVFPMSGAHANLACSSCHSGSEQDNYTGLRGECMICHLKDYNNTMEPDHSVRIYPASSCAECHNPSSWVDVEFSHTPDSENCSFCHLEDLEEANTSTAGHELLPNSCSVCHNTAAWTQVEFDHVLLGNLRVIIDNDAGCQSCHVNGFGQPVEGGQNREEK